MGTPPATGSSGASPSPIRTTSCRIELLDLYTPRSLEAIAGTLERIEGDMRAPGIEAALRLVLVGMLLPASKLNSFPGRVAQPRIVGGKLRPVGDRQWRERNPWLLMEDSFRQVRGFVQRLETGRQGTFHARFGPDLMALRDGSANVVVREGLTLTADEGEALAHLRPPAAGVTGTGSHVTGTGSHVTGTGGHVTGTGSQAAATALAPARVRSCGPHRP